MKENCQRTNERGGKNCLGPLSLSLSLSLSSSLKTDTRTHTLARHREQLGEEKNPRGQCRESAREGRERERIPQRVFLSSKCVRKFGSNAIKWVWAVFLLLPGPFLSLLLARTPALSDTHALAHTHSLSRFVFS